VAYRLRVFAASRPSRTALTAGSRGELHGLCKKCMSYPLIGSA